jgi:hypothetical protein
MGLGGFGEMLPYYENKVTSIIPKKTNGDNLFWLLIVNTKKMKQNARRYDE